MRADINGSHGCGLPLARDLYNTVSDKLFRRLSEIIAVFPRERTDAERRGGRSIKRGGSLLPGVCAMRGRGIHSAVLALKLAVLKDVVRKTFEVLIVSSVDGLGRTCTTSARSLTRSTGRARPHSTSRART